MEYIRINKDNLAKEHICCAISNNDDIQVSAKKSWLKERLDEGLVFLKSTERGKCFIEYIPTEYAWVPIKADNYLYIDCLWVSGSFKGHGYSNDLLNACIEDGKKQKKLGLCILSSAKKRGFLADPKFLSHKGFEAADEADNGIQLWYLPFKKDAQKPAFKDCARKVRIKDKGIVVNQPSVIACPQDPRSNRGRQQHQQTEREQRGVDIAAHAPRSDPVAHEHRGQEREDEQRSMQPASGAQRQRRADRDPEEEAEGDSPE